MTDSADDRPFSHVKHLREIRDRIGKELEHMTAEEAYQWHKSREYTDPTLRRLMSEAKPPKPPRSEYGTARALGLMPYPKYRPSGVEWLRDVPEHWEVKPLRRVLSRIDSKHGVEDASGSLLHVGMDSVESWTGRLLETPVVRSADPSSSFTPFLAGDILFGKLRPYLAKACHPDADGLCSSEFIVLRGGRYPNQASYLLYALLTPGFIDCVNLSTSGARMPRASWNWIGNLKIPLPAPSESSTIVLYLNRETTKIDALIRQQEILVEKLEEHRAALVSRTVTHGLSPDEARKAGLDPHPKFKPSEVEWLGEVPEHWEVRRLKHVAILTMGQSPPGHTVQATPPGLPFLQGCAEFGVRHPSPVHYCANPPKIAHGQALLMSVRAPVGNINVADQNYGIGRGLCAINPGTGWDNRFAYWQLRVMRYGLQRLATGSTYDAVSTSDVANLPLVLPTRREQRAIASYLDRETTKIDRVAEFARQEIHLLREYRTRLISDVVAGKVDVRGIAGTDMETAA